MISVNYFEMLEASPFWDERQIVLCIRRCQNIDAHIRQEVLRKLMNPSERLINELMTFHEPVYDNEITNNSKYKKFLLTIFNSNEFVNTLSINQTNYLYKKFLENSDLNDPWAKHSLAILHKRFALFQEEKGIYVDAKNHWKYFADYWSDFLTSENLLKETGTFTNYAGTTKEVVCLKTWNSMYQNMLNEINDDFKQAIKEKNYDVLGLRYSIIEHFKGKAIDNGDAVKLQDSMIGEIILQAESILDKSKYELFFDFIDKIKEVIICDNERLLFYNLEKIYNFLLDADLALDEEIKKINIIMGQCSDVNQYYINSKLLSNIRKAVNNFEIIKEKILSFLATSSHGYLIEPKINNIYSIIQAIAIRLSNNRKYRLALSLLTILPVDRDVKVQGGTTIKLSQFKYNVESSAIINNEYGIIEKQFYDIVNGLINQIFQSVDKIISDLNILKYRHNLKTLNQCLSASNYFSNAVNCIKCFKDYEQRFKDLKQKLAYPEIIDIDIKNFYSNVQAIAIATSNAGLDNNNLGLVVLGRYYYTFLPTAWCIPMREGYSAPVEKMISDLDNAISYMGGSFQPQYETNNSKKPKKPKEPKKQRIGSYDKYSYAGFWRRFFACIIDTAIVFGLYVPAIQIWGESEYSYYINLITVVYFLLFESSKWHATPGKKLLRIKIINIYGEGVGFFKSLLRTVYMVGFLFVIAFDLFYQENLIVLKVALTAIILIGMLIGLFDSKKQELHDKILGTLVVKN